ncbi:MAG: SOS response-associated peptidase family protein [Lautropia sp.]
MCYSAQVWADYRQFQRDTGSAMSIRDFYDLFVRWFEGKSRITIPKAMQEAFGDPRTELEREIKAMIDKRAEQDTLKLQQELFAQRKRLADAERALASKQTKAAAESKRIATNKIETAKRRLEDLQRTEIRPSDARIFPGHYAPVMVMESGQRVLKPMRYQCRPAGKPAFYDQKYPGTYNARRDNLEGFWKGLFGHTHAVFVVETFYENVDRDGKNVVLQFTPNPREPMFVACLYSHWVDKSTGEDLLSFAAITDEPPPEVAAAGHDRCIVQIRPENIDAWLSPDPRDLKAQYAILDDRPRPYYEHRLAA